MAVCWAVQTGVHLASVCERQLLVAPSFVSGTSACQSGAGFHAHASEGVMWCNTMRFMLPNQVK